MTHVYDPATAINDPNGITWGMHPIAWRNDDIPEVGEWNTIDIMFDDLAEAGFAGTEVAGWYPSKEETKEKADAAGLKIVAQWFSSFIVRDGVEAVIPDFRATCEYLQFLGATRVVVSEQTGSVQGVRDICIFENKPVLKNEEWPVLAEGLNKLGEIAHEYGLAGMFTVPGDGAIDFTEPYAFLVEHGYKGWILVEAEQDPKIAPPLEYAHIARDYVKGTLLGQ